MKTTIAIVDDHAIVRDGLRMLINSQPDLEVVGEGNNGEEAIAICAGLKPDILLMDVSMPKLGGIRSVPRIQKASRATRIILLTMHDEPIYLRSAMQGGCYGYVLKRAAYSELLKALRSVASGERYVDATLAATLLAGEAETLTGEDRPKVQLSARELHVLKLLARGFTYQEAAEHLLVSARTIETYRVRLARKLGVRNRADLIKYAVQMDVFRGAVASEGD